MLTAVPYLLRLFRFSPIDNTIPGKVGKSVLVGADLAFYLAAAILYIFENSERRDLTSLETATQAAAQATA
jgi:hypothetical protein